MDTRASTPELRELRHRRCSACDDRRRPTATSSTCPASRLRAEPAAGGPRCAAVHGPCIIERVTFTADLRATILDAIGDTPLVRINRLTQGVIAADGAGEDRDVQSRQLDQGPHGRQDDRGRRARRPAQARRDDHRRHVRQHRHGPGDCRRREGLQVHLHDHRQAVEGKGRRAPGVRRRSHRLPDQRGSGGSALVLLGVVAARARDAERVEGEPVRQPLELAGALRTDRPGDLGADRRPHHAPRRRASAPAARSAASAGSSRNTIRRSRSGASTRTGRSSRNTRRPASSTRTRSTRTSPKASARTSCRRTWTSPSSITSRRSPTRTRPS